MVEIQHFAHHCTSSLSETAGIDGTCSLCFKETSIHYTCHACGFELCKSCFKLSDTKLTHGLHPQHLLHFHLRQSDEKPQSFVCCGCGFVSAGSYYECKECEIKIDLECISKEIAREWEEKSIYHYSHRHMLRLCRLGADFSSSCLMCDGDVSCTTRCYGCVYCLYFIHEWCIDLPREIRHPVHPPHSLRRLNYVQHGERKIICNACQDMIYGIPFGCIECKFNLHIECADSLLRGLEHESHSHALFYVARNALYAFTREKPCHICKSSGKYFKNSYYRCVKCDLNFHLECLKLPSLLSSRSRHPHPLWCKTFDESCDNHCEFCETVISDGSHAYYCKECEFYAHVECIFRKEKPSPMYLRSLYSYDAEDVSRGNEGTDGGSYSGDTDGDQLKIFDVTHTHMLQRFDDMGGVSNTSCSVCKHKLDIRAYRCVFHVSGKCEFVAHEACAKLGQQSTRRFHRSHPLTLLPVPPAQNMECDMCKKAFKDFNLFCRTCDYVICLRCARGDTRLVQKVARGKKTCMAGHNLVQFFERSKPVDCSICDEIVHGKGSACPQCEETYHDQCLQLVGQSVVRPSHSPYHSLYLRGSNGGMRCADCRRKVRNYGYICTDDPCMWGPIFYHVKCPEATLEVECHEHNLRCFRAHIDQSGSITNLECNACRKPCNVDCFYGCEKCSLSYHVECLGLLVHAKYKEFFWHIMRLRYSLTDMPSSLRCDRCKSPFDPVGPAYKCELCDCALHLECLLPLDKDDIALTREERDLELVKSLKVYDRETQKDYCTKDVLDRRDVSERISALEKSEFLMHLHAECEANWNATVTKSDFLRALLKGGSKMRHVEEAYRDF
ncbi:PREDICTED: uncharacterized protein LOC104814999 isoform X2 [Tarenaya hassleriana]|uniref:uncharacterized protein LOC104814999 isoform X2 n=1 Tax=Tarenaya hassleriana TaxID=28532 RepID=UPI00053C5D1A|nr:PREDICTED: uncharacterized protein LOC104814999 isoform X2 [Tarenaya hassleriana]